VRRELEQLIERVEPRVEPPLEQLSGESLAAVLQTAWAHERAGELEAARAAVAHLPDEDSPLRYDALLLRGRVQRRCGELEAAEQTLSQATAAAPQRPEAVVEQAWLHLDQRDSEAALRLAQRARELTTSADPAQVAAWAHALGAAAAAAGRYEETGEALERLRAVLPGAPATQQLARERDRLAVQAGWHRESRGDFAGALAAAESVGEQSRYASEARRLRARLLRRSGQTAAARQLLEELVRAEPTGAEAIVELAWLCLDCEDLDAGLQLARRARELARSARGRDDNDQWAHVLAALATAAAVHREAADALQVLLARRQPKPAAHAPEPRDGEALAAAARHEEQGEWEQALAALAHLGRGSPLQYDAAVLRARVLRRSGSDQAARRILAIAIAIDPARWEAVVELAWGCLEAGELDSGQRLAHLALEAPRSNGEARGTAAAAHALALLAAAAGDRATAVAALERLESARPDNLDTAAVRDEALRQLGEQV
jgi:hypothetical protein